MSVVGVALAGGASRRMGRDKAVMMVAGERLVDRAIRKLESVCDRVVVADRGRGLIEGLSVDDGPGKGPAAGILGVARDFPEQDLLVFACDLPGVPPGLLEVLNQTPGDLVMPLTSRGLEPLCAIYRPRALAKLRERVEEGLFALHPLSEETEIDVCLVEGSQLERWGDSDLIFRNLNRPNDLADLG